MRHCHKCTSPVKKQKFLFDERTVGRKVRAGVVGCQGAAMQQVNFLYIQRHNRVEHSRFAERL